MWYTKVDKSVLKSFINILLSDKQWCLTATARKTTERVAHIKAAVKMHSCHLCYTESTSCHKDCNGFQKSLT